MKNAPDYDRRYLICLLGPLFLGVSLGMQITMTAWCFWGVAKKDALFWNQFTDYGKSAIKPEHDLGIYVAGVFLSLGISLLNVLWWRRQLNKTPAEHLNGCMRFSALIHGTAAVISLGFYLLLLFSYHFCGSGNTVNVAIESLGRFAMGALLLPSLMAVVWVIYDTKRYLHSIAFPDGADQWLPRLNRFLLYATPIFIVLVLGVLAKNMAVFGRARLFKRPVSSPVIFCDGTCACFCAW